ncbi:patatin-like phospholipase family protein [Modestobacter excelsi]|uniref:patatin-like phospholipase family protein n=1 Tax=Modestobacter excelsi TaxID=2213161 RepID=UPI00110CBC47|nr:patatin-like phospholipase family protein [Modestobacter excelsi]
MLESPAAVAVSGHMVDTPDREVPRFPPGQIGRVAREVDEAFDAWKVGPGTTVVCGGARGADILAAEAGLRRGARIRVCLALPPDEFERRSVDLPGSDWSARFRELLQRSEVEVPPPGEAAPDDEDAFARANVRLVEVAGLLAASPNALLVWNGKGGDGPGGTLDFVRRLGFTRPGPRVRVIDPTPRRYEDRQEAPGPKKLLTLDGGGIRGVLTLEVLAELEQQLRRRRGDTELVLSDYFDYIGGTSTGAIIAAALAMGKPVEEVRERYETLGRKVFRRRFLPMRLRSLYRDGRLTEELEGFFGPGTTLGDPGFRSLLLVVLHNTVTDSPWPLSNCTRARYNSADRYLNTEPDRNLDLPLSTVIRGSTAAPVYFPPQRMRVGAADFVFQDGGMTPFNNAALLLFLMATLSEYGLCWPAGEDELLIVSVGTGSAASVHPGLLPHRAGLLFNAANFPGVFMRGASVGQDLVCRSLGRTRAGDEIDREFGARLDAVAPGGRNLFTYLRYDADLAEDALAVLGVPQRDRGRLRKLDAVGAVPLLQAVGRAVAGQVDVDGHLAGFD